MKKLTLTMMFLATLLLATSLSFAGDGSCCPSKGECNPSEKVACPQAEAMGAFDASYTSQETAFAKACDGERKRDGKCEEKREDAAKRKGGCRKSDSCK